MRLRWQLAGWMVVAACGTELDAGAHTYDKEPSPGDPSTLCNDWCATREPMVENGGWCPAEGWNGETTCAESCVSLLQTGPAFAVQHCVEDDALCFIAMEGCIDAWVRFTSCEEWCAHRATEHENEGFCDPTLAGLPETDCRTVCIRGLADSVGDVELCIRDNPLCFQDLGACSAAQGSP